MAYHQNILPTLLISCFLAFSMAASRPLDSNPKQTLMARLKLDQETDKGCWDSLFQLQSCTGEVILFFLNGETYLGPGCCSAVRIIEHLCWPSMLGSLGFTPEEGDILRGYCDAAESDSGSGSSPPPPEAFVGPNVNMSRDSIP
ncbi:hypothetical protein RHMOL_Rhmol08G0005400 [Rhododendron molle]|uniref:Uncharacterized protein n=1 Tax=Rhododendron molle TaxID=49168 RepID=A0ACC0MJN3_RHOML|nr:hypothetical protein RHMOL_Rhmol08G0005400 [Rhododendron molle]